DDHVLRIGAAQGRRQGLHSLLLSDNLVHRSRPRLFRKGLRQGDGAQFLKFLHFLARFPVDGRPAGLLVFEQVPKVQTDDHREKHLQQHQKYRPVHIPFLPNQICAGTSPSSSRIVWPGENGDSHLRQDGTKRQPPAFASGCLLIHQALSSFFSSMTRPSRVVRRGPTLFRTLSFVTTHLVTSSREGSSNITSSMIDSMIALRPRAPVFRLIASAAIVSRASSSNTSSTPSISINF